MNVIRRARAWLKRNYLVRRGRKPPFEPVLFNRVFPHLATVRISLQCFEECIGGVTLKELSYLSILAKSIESAQIFEIGTSMGRTTLNMAINLDPGGHIYSLDLPDGFIPDESCYARAQNIEVCDLPRAQFLQPFMDHLPVTLLQGESTAFDFKPWFGKMDLVFVDGGHTYKVLESDSENAMKMIKKSGMVIWHDYEQPSCPEVAQFINNLALRLPLRHIEGTNMALYLDGFR